METLNLRPPEDCRWDLVSLGEILLRFDPGTERIPCARSFRVFDGGAEYNVACNVAKISGSRTAIVSALTDNALGRLAENLAHAGRVDTSEILWRDGSAGTRNGTYYIERGFGIRGPSSCFDRAGTAISQLKPSDVDWQAIFGKSGTRVFHTGGVFAGLSEGTHEVAQAAMSAARASGALVSYDLNYRDSLWKDRGGRDAANSVNSALLPHADVVFGVMGLDARLSRFDGEKFRAAAADMMNTFPNLKLVCSTLRDVHSASRHDLSGACFGGGEVFKARDYIGVEVLDRVGSGDAFAAGVIHGILSSKDLRYTVEFAAAHAALVMTTPGDNSTATAAEVEELMRGGRGGVSR